MEADKEERGQNINKGVELGCAGWAGSERKMGKMVIRES